MPAHQRYRTQSFLFPSRQELSFIEIQKTPIVASSAQYVDSGSLKYEFPSELFETPLQLVKISNLQAQV